MLSKKKQYITWIVGLGLSPFLFLIAFRATASIELFMNPSFYLFIFLGIIVSLFPIEIKGTTIFLINSVGMAVFVSHGLFAEMILMTIATIALLIRIGVSKEESFRFPLNILMFQIVSILSAEIYYIVDSIFFPSTNYTYSILSLIIYSVSHTTFNDLLLYLISTKWQKKNYGNFFDFEYFFSIFSIIYTIPIALIILYLDDLYSTLGIVIASLPLIVISLSFKLYFFSDSQNQYLAEINSLAVKLTGKNTVNEIIELYLKSWSNIFPADTIYFFTTSDNEEISKTCAYRVGNNVSLKDSTVKTSFNYKALENFGAHNDMIVYHNSNEWSESIRKEIDYPAESVLILPIKNSETLFGFFIMTDPKRNVYTKKILSVVPVLHNYLNIAIENAQNFEKLQTNSRTDHLTGLANIRSFELHLEHFNQINPDTRFSIIIIDLDYFKDVNDSYGHQAGNELLKQVAILLNTFIYDQEKLARYGGEEFIYFLPDKSTEEAFELAEIIRSEIENTVFNTHNYLGERELVNVNITASMGLATYPDQCSNIKELLTLADRAMYIGSKQNGRNKVAFLNGGDIVEPGDMKVTFKSQEGTTLVELIVAIGILAIVVTSFLIFFIQSSQTTQSSENITDATYLAQEEMEYLYHLSDSKSLDESIQELINRSSSANGNGLDRTFTIQSEGITFILEMKEAVVETTEDTTLIHFILKGQNQNKQLVQLESKIPFKNEVQND